MILSGDSIANIWFPDNDKNLKTPFVFEKYGPNEKKCLQQNFDFTIVSKNLVQIGSLRDIKFVKKNMQN